MLRPHWGGPGPSSLHLLINGLFISALAHVTATPPPTLPVSSELWERGSGLLCTQLCLGFGGAPVTSGRPQFPRTQGHGDEVTDQPLFPTAASWLRKVEVPWCLTIFLCPGPRNLYQAAPFSSGFSEPSAQFSFRFSPQRDITATPRGPPAPLGHCRSQAGKPNPEPPPPQDPISPFPELSLPRAEAPVQNFYI